MRRLVPRVGLIEGNCWGKSSPAGKRGLSSYAKCAVVDVNLNISLRLRKCPSVYQGMSPFECCEDVDVNFSFSLRLRLRASVHHGASSCADCYVLEWKLFFFHSFFLVLSFHIHLLSSRRAHWELHGASLGYKTRASGFLSGEKGIVIVRVVEPTAL